MQPAILSQKNDLIIKSPVLVQSKQKESVRGLAHAKASGVP